MKDNSASDFETLFVKKKTSGFRISVILFGVFLLGFIALYTILTVGAVRDRMRLAHALTEGAAPVSPSLIGLMKQKAWVESRLKMAGSDSIGLSINLQDHLIQLELKGVVVMSTRIRDYSTSGFFKRMEGNVYFSMFGTPLTIQQFESSIEKNPLKVILAPKNAEEAEAAKTMKDTIHHEVFWTVMLDRDFELNIQGIDSISDAQSGYKLGKGFEFKRDLKNIGKAFQQIIRFKKPLYTPEILISIPDNEAKAILRALPRKALVTIRI